MIALASTGPKRTSYLPALPTVQERGLKDFDVVSWNGISVPAATPKPVVEILSRAINAVLPSPDVQDKATKLGMEMRGRAAVIEKAGIPKHE